MPAKMRRARPTPSAVVAFVTQLPVIPVIPTCSWLTVAISSASPPPTLNPPFTPPTFTAGIFVGNLLCFSNTYFGLQSGCTCESRLCLLLFSGELRVCPLLAYDPYLPNPCTLLRCRAPAFCLRDYHGLAAERHPGLWHIQGAARGGGRRLCRLHRGRECA